jgi:hypothetical protein
MVRLKKKIKSIKITGKKIKIKIKIKIIIIKY